MLKDALAQLRCLVGERLAGEAARVLLVEADGPVAVGVAVAPVAAPVAGASVPVLGARARARARSVQLGLRVLSCRLVLLPSAVQDGRRGWQALFETVLRRAGTRAARAVRERSRELGAPARLQQREVVLDAEVTLALASSALHDAPRQQLLPRSAQHAQCFNY